MFKLQTMVRARSVQNRSRRNRRQSRSNKTRRQCGGCEHPEKPPQDAEAKEEGTATPHPSCSENQSGQTDRRDCGWNGNPEDQAGDPLP